MLRYRQELFMLFKGAEDGSEEPLSDHFEFESACTVVLCMKPEWEWEWERDAASELIKRIKRSNSAAPTASPPRLIKMKISTVSWW